MECTYDDDIIAIAVNKIPFFDNETFCPVIDEEYVCIINGDKVLIKRKNKVAGIQISLERFNMIFVEKNEYLRQIRQNKLERILKNN